MTTWPTDLVIALFPLMLVVWLIFDVAVAFVWPQVGIPTITRRIQVLSRDYPAIPALACLIMGLLIAHFWGQF